MQNWRQTPLHKLWACFSLSTIFKKFQKNYSMTGQTNSQTNTKYFSQYGFRTNWSTTLALTELVEEITNSIAQKSMQVGYALILKKDLTQSINHVILINKLEQYGIRGAVYISDICKVSQLLKFVLFADDTNIFWSDHLRTQQSFKMV